MSECDQISGMFLELHEGSVDSETRSRCYDHMNECSCCREEFQWYSDAVKALAGLERVSPPRDFMVHLDRRLDAVSSRSWLDFLKDLTLTAPRMPLPAGMAALFCIVLIGYSLFRQPPVELARHSETPVSAEVATAEEGGKSIAPAPRRATITTMGGDGALAPAYYSSLSNPSTNLPRIPLTTPESGMSGAQAAHNLLPTVADRLGADNLTVVSSRPEEAQELLKRILPGLQGTVVREDLRPSARERLVRIIIPPDAYGSLTRALVDHGEIESGAGAGVDPPKPVQEQGNGILLYVRFVKPQ
ncbi:MAG: hypothetical protein FJ118_11630 [Deltaproteobacteria bacterium]|nr:hypothetical protein [Deltaproteobacteria bacterium]